MDQPVIEHWPMEIHTCNSKKLRRTATRMFAGALRRGNIDPFHLACAICFFGAARYECAEGRTLDFGGAPRELKEAYPSVPIVAGLVFGEIGVGTQGRALMRNWTVSGLLLADEFSPRDLHRRGYRALADAGKRLAETASLDEVLAAAMDMIVQAGFPGGMISLVFHDRKSWVTVALEARGKGWRRIVPLTRRRGDSDDLLVLVANRRIARFVPDSRRDKYNDPAAVKLSGMISQYVLPLKTPGGRVIGLVEVDLGDMSSTRQLPRHLAELTQALASQIAVAVSRAIRMHELELSNLFDRAVAASLTKPTVAEAAQEFVDVVVGAKLLGTDMLHIRLATPDGESLQLVAGSGAYYEAAKQHRPAIPCNEDSPSARAFRDQEPVWANNIEDDEHSRAFAAGLKAEPVREVFQTERSYVNLLIRARDEDRPIGVINIAAREPWFFSESLWRSMEKLGQRLFFALEHAKNIEAERRTARELRLLLETLPDVSEEDLETSLREHAGKIAQAEQADVVSFFLWDPEREALVLRAQHGWERDMIGRAQYQLHEGMTGMAARPEAKPMHIPDLQEWKRGKPGQGPAKYGKQMFGPKWSQVRCEVIAIPLRFGNLLGVLTMHNRIRPTQVGSRFATIEPHLLAQVANDLSAFVYASLASEAARAEVRRARRLGNLDQLLLEQGSDISELAEQVCC
ncbi:MAG TPA: GAF domain-containing protein, partial [Thermoguttaceae bacterium]|nr:GAF domain-containing protein [Thermoguttaceae bacterium]